MNRNVLKGDYELESKISLNTKEKVTVTKPKKDSAKMSRRFLLFWCFFVGIGAVLGSLCMFLDPTGKTFGMDSFFEGFEKLPFNEVLFQNLIFPGISLLIVNGISNLVAAVLILKKKTVGVLLGAIFGVTLMLWITIQFVIFPANVLSTAYFVFGIVQFITGYVCYVRTKQDYFRIEEESYPEIKAKSDVLVVYFSRMGYTKKLAYEIANEQKAELLELKTRERTDGTLGFWWCGRFGMHGWTMPIEKIKKQLGTYKKVVICTPIWVFGVAAPVKSFLKVAKGQVKSVDYVLNHFNPNSYVSTANTMDKMLQMRATKVTSVTIRLGKVKKVKVLR